MSAPEVPPMELGKFKLRQHEFQLAEKAFLKEIEKNPDNDEAWYYLGYCRKRLFRVEEALEPLKKAYKLNDSVPDYLYDLASTYIAVGLPEKGKEIAKKLKDMDQNRFSQEQIDKLLS
jgi:tetratricopeptide (TPR) repeat protein